MHIFHFQFLWFNFEIACILSTSDKYQVKQTPAVDRLYYPAIMFHDGDK